MHTSKPRSVRMMPRITLYVPNDLKAGMDEAGEALNWSALAQRAFREAILNRSVRRSPKDMTSVVERLRASKERIEARDHEAGQAQGREWAETAAEYDELKRVAESDIDNADYGGSALQWLQGVIDPNGQLHPMD